ncbi:MAG: NAD(P)/FAD-dependent oxidoreductase [bacterium]|nr:NAD(P)/FAD-dependent oxidoreductase [bacterium]
MNKRSIVVIGGGPAGMMAAIRAGQLTQERASLAETTPLIDVVLIEKNLALGKKLLLTGKCRCNLTNACDIETLLGKFHKNGRFLRTALNTFSNTDLMQFFEGRGLPLKVERQSRVFPATDMSLSVLEVLKKELAVNRVRIVYNAQLKDILVEDNQIKGVLLKEQAGSQQRVGDRVVTQASSLSIISHEEERVGDREQLLTAPYQEAGLTKILCDRIILATGGISYGWTGSTGDGLKIAQRLGHRIIPLRAGLVPLRIKGHYPKLLEGLTLKNIQLVFRCGKQQVTSEVGELLFTDFGISGPLILSLSGQIVDWLDADKKDKAVLVSIDLKPGMSHEQLDARFLREFNANPKKSIRSILKFFLPQRMVDVFMEIAGILQDKQANQINRDERYRLAALFKGLQLEVIGTLPVEQAMITQGGVSLKDINPRTMESCIISGLYFAGEIMDVDADTGGFNLQASFSTGYLAGESAALDE